MGTGISEASKRVPIFSFATQGGKQVRSHFTGTQTRTGTQTSRLEQAQIRLPAAWSESLSGRLRPSRPHQETEAYFTFMGVRQRNLARASSASAARAKSASSPQKQPLCVST